MVVFQTGLSLALCAVTFLATAWPVKKSGNIWRGLAGILINETLFLFWRELVNTIYILREGEVTLNYLSDYYFFGMVLWMLYWSLSLFSYLLFICPVLRGDKKRPGKMELALKAGIFVMAPLTIYFLLEQVASAVVVSNEKGLMGLVAAVIIFSVYLFLYVLVERYYVLANNRNEYEKMEQYRMEQLEFYQTKMVSEERLREIYHDMNKYYEAFQMLKDEAPEEVTGYIGELEQSMHEFERPFETGNALVDTILMDKEKEAKKRKIPFEVSIQTRRLKNYKSVYLCSVFANALDNAIEACERQREKAFIHVDITKMGEGVYILFQNPYRQENVSEDELKTWKKDSLFHGLGLRNIKNAVERCGGDMSIHMGEGVFALSVILP